SVDLASKSWYVHLWSPGHRYGVELGVERHGEFVPLARSKTIHTPRAFPVVATSESFTRPLQSPAREEERLAPIPEPPRPTAPLPPPQRPPEIAEVRQPSVAVAVSPPPAAVSAPIPVADRAAPPSATTAPSPPQAPHRAYGVLRERLSELQGFREWGHPPSPVPESSGLAVSPEPSRPALDLTAHAETRFILGVSSNQP